MTSHRTILVVCTTPMTMRWPSTSSSEITTYRRSRCLWLGGRPVFPALLVGGEGAVEGVQELLLAVARHQHLPEEDLVADHAVAQVAVLLRGDVVGIPVPDSHGVRLRHRL